MVRPTSSNRIRRSPYTTPRKQTSNSDFNFCPKYSVDDLQFKPPTPLVEDNPKDETSKAVNNWPTAPTKPFRSLNGAIAAQDTDAVQDILTDFEHGDLSSSQQMELNYGLSLAITGKSAKLVEILLKTGADIHTNDQFYPLIMTAIDLGLAEIFNLMMEFSEKPSTDFVSQYGTLLHAAVRAKSVDIVRLLLERGLGVNDKSEAQGATPLHIAVRFIKVTYSNEKLFESNKRKSTNESIIPTSNSKEITTKEKSPKGIQSLELAAPVSEKEIVECLLASGAGVDAVDNSGRTPLHYAAIMGYDDVIQLLVDNNASLSVMDDDNYIPWMYAIKFKSSRNIKTVPILCPKDINARYEEGKTLLHQCCASGNTYGLKVLLENGADFNIVDDTGNSCVMSACLHGKLDIVELLLPNVKELVNVRNNDGDTPFYSLCKPQTLSGNKEDSMLKTLQLILDNGAEINNVHPENDDTVLMRCVTSEPLRNWLLDHGANLNTVTKTKTFLGSVASAAVSYNLDTEDIKSIFRRNVDMTLGHVPHEGCLPIQTLFQHGNADLIELFLDAGLSVTGLSDWLQTDEAKERRQGNTEIDILMKRAELELVQPIGLQHMGRHAALRALGHSDVSNKTKMLGLPKLLERFLDIDVYMCCRRNDAELLEL